MSAREIEIQAKLIESMAATMKGNDWADEILARCDTISKAVQDLRKLANAKKAGER